MSNELYETLDDARTALINSGVLDMLQPRHSVARMAAAMYRNNTTPEQAYEAALLIDEMFFDGDGDE